MHLTIRIKPDGSYTASGRSRKGIQIAYIVGWAMRAAREIVKAEETLYENASLQEMRRRERGI